MWLCIASYHLQICLFSPLYLLSPSYTYKYFNILKVSYTLIIIITYVNILNITWHCESEPYEINFSALRDNRVLPVSEKKKIPLRKWQIQAGLSSTQHTNKKRTQLRPPRSGRGRGLKFAPDSLCLQPARVGVSRYCVDDTHSGALPHSKTGLPWGRRQVETTLNGSTMTSHTLPGEKKSWVRKSFIKASVTHLLRCLAG